MMHCESGKNSERETKSGDKGKFHGSGLSLANESPWGTGESFASNGATPGDGAGALLIIKMQQLWIEMWQQLGIK
jgi:hypothetical protein